MKPPCPPTTDWLSFIKKKGCANGYEFDLRQLRAGDFLQVITRHTTYDFRIVSPQEAVLETGRSDRPQGRVRILGCTFGQSSSIKPDHLFCGGNLNFIFENGRMTHLTTSIREIRWLRVGNMKPGEH